MGKRVASGGVLALTVLAVLLVAIRAGLLPASMHAAVPLARATATPQRTAQRPAPVKPRAVSSPPHRATPVAHPIARPTTTPAHAPAPSRHGTAGSPHRPAPSAHPRPGWRLLYAGGGAPILDLACFDARRCLATGSLMLTEAGGAPRAIGALLTTDGGLRWQPTEASPLAHLACAGPALCLAPADAGPLLRSTEGGRAWTLARARTQARALSCPTVSFCAAIDGETAIALSHDGGATWKVVWSGAAALWRIACPSAAVCVAVGNGGAVYTHAGGRVWTAVTPASSLPLLSVACPKERNCYATSVAGELLASRDGGASWAVQETTGAELDGVACADVRLCLAVGVRGAAYLTRDGGATWRAQRLPTHQDLRAVACPTTHRCYVGGATGVLLGWQG